MAKAAVNAKSTIGLKDLVIAPITADTTASTTYGTLQKVAGTISASISPSTTDPNIQYFDDIEGDVLYPDPDDSLKTELADLPLSIQAMILNNHIDDNGVLVRTAGDTPQYFAVGYRAVKTDGKYRYVWLLKCRAKPITENYKTKEGSTVTRQPVSVEWVSIKRNSDQQYRYTADEGENGFTSQMAATFLNSVYTPVFATTEVPFTAIEMDETTLTFSSATAQNLTVTKTPATANQPVLWGTSNGAVATVNDNGQVTPGKNGTCKIIAIVKDTDLFAECTVTVNIAGA